MMSLVRRDVYICAVKSDFYINVYIYLGTWAGWAIGYIKSR